MEQGSGDLGSSPGLQAAPPGPKDSHVTPTLPGFPVCKTRGLDQIISGSDVCTSQF